MRGAREHAWQMTSQGALHKKLSNFTAIITCSPHDIRHSRDGKRLLKIIVWELTRYSCLQDSVYGLRVASRIDEIE